MRLYLGVEDVAAIIAAPASSDVDRNGNPRYTARVGMRFVRVVVARDDPTFIIDPPPEAPLMRALYDSEADALQIDLEDEHVEHVEEVEGGAAVGLAGDHVVGVEVLGARAGIDEPLAAAAERYGLDREALEAAGRSALAAPDRLVVLEVGARALA